MTDVDAVHHLVDAEQLVVDELGLADPRHPGAGVLEAEHQAAAQLALAAGQLLVGDAVRGDRASSVRTTAEHLVELVRQAADRDPDQAGVGVVAGEGEDRVGQAAALADLLEQPRRRAAAEGGVEHAEGEAAVVVAGHALHAEHEVDLLERAGRLDHAGCTPHRAGRPWPGPTGGSSSSSQPWRPNAARTWRTHGRVVEVAGGGDDHVARAGSAAGRTARPGRAVSASIEPTVPAIGRPSGVSP